MTYDHHLFQLAFRKYQEHGGVRKTARAVDVSPSTISRWIKRSNWVDSRKRSVKRTRVTYSPKLTPEVCITIFEYFNTPTFRCTNARLCTHHLQSTLGIHISVTTLRRCLRKIGISRKRLSSKILGLADPQKVSEFKRNHAELIKDDTLAVSVDECYFSERVAPLYGYSEVGTRCVHRIGKGGWKQRSLVLGIANDGTHFSQVFEGGVNRDMFKSYVRDMPYPPETVLILDNCSTHKSIDDALNERGFRALYLSPYSPNFQPVELAFSKVKGLYRTAFPWPEGVIESINTSVNKLTESNNIGYFNHAKDELEKITG